MIFSVLHLASIRLPNKWLFRSMYRCRNI